MPAIVNEFTIEAAPGRAWDALTRPEEIARWWTDDLSATPEVGTLAEFRFRQGTFVIQFEVAELDQDEKVRWITRQGPATGHWAGTSVTWQLTPVHGWSSTTTGSLKLMSDMKLHVHGGNTSWSA
jgi:uncharacterized protein YndB with AHSA1/START domain